ncbi:hypothetical protein GIB67_027974 [Kingdonia uniflora]|uniref:Gamma-glutamylcyclotransferase AIG2-like domain-containing protein n=1 Tax=Kingdonia uniflora TaxID=39325 RepID=A0A7J7LGM0_9MAGN|nr:hypothetical protein GIB67_027974 [Kingdonia uniflora]
MFFISCVLLGITDPELDILDTFEDVEYEKHTVDVSLSNTEENFQAYTYVWENKNDPNLYGNWDFEVTLFSALPVFTPFCL